MDRCRFFLALLICACLSLPALAAEAEEDLSDLTENEVAAVPPEESESVEMTEPPAENVETVENPSPPEVIASDPENQYHITADTIIIQPVPSVEDDPEESPPVDPPLDDEDGVLEDPASPDEGAPDAPEESEDPLPVVVFPSEESFPSVYAAAPSLSLDIDDTPPASPLFYGAVYVTGTDSRLGTVTVYFPANYQSGVLGLDASGYLCSVYSGSVSGYLSGVNNNRVSLSTFSRPTYSQYSGSSTQQYTLNLRPTSSNADLMTSSLPRMTVQQLYPYLMIFLLGVILVCCMKRL